MNMGDQFKGLPMADLIGGPLMAASDAQVKLANATADFIKVIGFLPPPDDTTPVGDVRTALFKFDRPSPTATPPAAGQPVPMETVELEVPMLAIVKIPSLSINTVDVMFDMEVKDSQTDKSSFDAAASLSATGQAGWGPFSVKVSITGSISTHKESTRQTDKSAKYHVEVHAEDSGMPEGLARVLDIVQSSIAPKQITPPGP
tara:strand:+ start:683 stop:1288 length:606 start_codon:yes stop_codon:yes gene_type:complete